MRDVTDRIFKGAMTVFIKKGLQATTQEVAKEANVAEVTLYRRYATKENLFITVLKSVLEKKFHTDVLVMAKEENTELFFMRIIDNRLEVLSKNSELVRMLLSESLRGNLKAEINLPEIIFTSLKDALTAHFEQKNVSVDVDFHARQLGGIFLSYVILPTDIPFHQLSAEKKERVVKAHTQAILETLTDN